MPAPPHTSPEGTICLQYQRAPCGKTSHQHQGTSQNGKYTLESIMNIIVCSILWKLKLHLLIASPIPTLFFIWHSKFIHYYAGMFVISIEFLNTQSHSPPCMTLSLSQLTYNCISVLVHRTIPHLHQALSNKLPINKKKRGGLRHEV